MTFAVFHSARRAKVFLGCVYAYGLVARICMALPLCLGADRGKAMGARCGFCCSTHLHRAGLRYSVGHRAASRKSYHGVRTYAAAATVGILNFRQRIAILILKT